MSLDVQGVGAKGLAGCERSRRNEQAVEEVADQPMPKIAFAVITLATFAASQAAAHVTLQRRQAP